MPAPNATDLLTPEQYAARTGIALSTAAKHRTTGRGCPFVKLGGAVRYRVETVEQFLRNERHSTSDERAA